MKNIVVLLFLIGAKVPALATESYVGLTQSQVSAFGEELGGGMWGGSLDYAIDIRRLKDKIHIFLIEFYGEFKLVDGGKKRRSTRTVDHIEFVLGADEKVSDSISFRCLDGQTSVVGVFKKKQAKAEGRFPAVRAWKIVDKKIASVTKLDSVSCDWFRNGDGDFPREL